MQAAETDYLGRHSPTGFLGQVADQSLVKIISRTVETNPLAFGAVAAQGVQDRGVAPTADAPDGTVFVGITVRDQVVALAPDGTKDTYSVGDTANIFTKGPIWVSTAVAVAAGDPVYFTAAGAFTNVETSNILIANARWDTSTSGAGMPIVHLA